MCKRNFTSGHLLFNISICSVSQPFLKEETLNFLKMVFKEEALDRQICAPGARETEKKQTGGLCLNSSKPPR